MNKVQEMQNKIYREMSAEKKIKLIDDFYQYSKKLQKANDYDHTKIHRTRKSS